MVGSTPQISRPGTRRKTPLFRGARQLKLDLASVSNSLSWQSDEDSLVGDRVWSQLSGLIEGPDGFLAAHPPPAVPAHDGGSTVKSAGRQKFDAAYCLGLAKASMGHHLSPGEFALQQRGQFHYGAAGTSAKDVMAANGQQKALASPGSFHRTGSSKWDPSRSLKGRVLELEAGTTFEDEVLQMQVRPLLNDQPGPFARPQFRDVLPSRSRGAS